MTIALEIGTVLALGVMVAAYVSSLPKPKRVRIPVKDGRVVNRGPHQH